VESYHVLFKKNKKKRVLSIFFLFRFWSLAKFLWFGTLDASRLDKKNVLRKMFLSKTNDRIERGRLPRTV